MKAHWGKPGEDESVKTLSVIIPALNEAQSLETLHARLDAVLRETGRAAEIIFVDDGSRDETAEVLRAIHARDPRVTVLRFRRNQGKSAALAAGFAQARGEVLVTMDADLQDDPAEIPRLLAALDEGRDLVVGWKVRRHDPAVRVLASRLFNAVVSRALGLRLHDMNCGLKVLRREVAADIVIYGELHRFLVGLAHLNGFVVGEVPVTHHPRKFGSSKFGLRRYIEGAFDLITVLFLSHFQVRPMHLFGTMGLGFLGVGMTLNLYLTVLWSLGTPLANRPLLFLGMLLCILGVQLFSTGLIGEMVARSTARRLEHPVAEVWAGQPPPSEPEERP
jgi:glycosyltransferase involved in cell wall biosynthesis